MMYMPSIFGENLMNDWFADFDNAFFDRKPVAPKAPRAFMKADIRELESGYEVDIDLPGFKKEDIKLELSNGSLSIAASKEEKKEEKEESGKLIRQERYTGSMERRFYVGKDITEEDIKARFEDGVLKLFIPKKEVKPAVPEKKTIAIEG